ncbi:putative transporter protein [Lachnellula arida]|uniref:Putative transporter protein n=1 Tax=Lachnellula arida TaxID=1316785 RepID=A0A8T9B1K9_9HELO|nr:putative transporter protein [Lachnellula arida]
MPHSTRASSASRVSNFKFPADGDQSPSLRSSMEKFPDHVESLDGSPIYTESPSVMSGNNLLHPAQAADRWYPGLSRIDSGEVRKAPWNTGGRGIAQHGRQKSLSDAFRTIRTRSGSMSQNVHEISDALKAPVSPKLITLCIIWYFSSALTNTSSKSILNAFPKPATLTLIQFAFVATFCIFFSWLSSLFPALKHHIPALRHGIRSPTREVIKTTLPLAAFQIGGHLLSSTATAKIPVSLVHTIKGLSPLFTVFAYRIIFDIRYPVATYLSLIPLTLGVMLACSASFKGNFFGILYAFLAAIIFVTQNIFSKRLFNEASQGSTRKLDKLNLLCYSSGLAFLLTSPIWFWSEGFGLLGDFLHDGSLDLVQHANTFDHGRLALEFLFNGTFHFAQNILAFVLLSMVSPVTYSVASLIKRVFVVVCAIIWFQNPVSGVQGIGIGLTFLGLYLYDRTNEQSRADRKASMMDVKPTSILPTSAPNINTGLANGTGNGISIAPTRGVSNGYALSNLGEDKKNETRGRASSHAHATWMPPGTKQEDTWRPNSSGLGISVK